MIKILQLSMLIMYLSVSMTNAQEFVAGEKQANSILNELFTEKKLNAEIIDTLCQQISDSFTRVKRQGDNENPSMTTFLIKSTYGQMGNVVAEESGKEIALFEDTLRSLSEEEQITLCKDYWDSWNPPEHFGVTSRRFIDMLGFLRSPIGEQFLSLIERENGTGISFLLLSTEEQKEIMKHVLMKIKPQENQHILEYFDLILQSFSMLRTLLVHQFVAFIDQNHSSLGIKLQANIQPIIQRMEEKEKAEGQRFHVELEKDLQAQRLRLNEQNYTTQPIAKPKLHEIFVPMFIILLGSNRLVMSEYYRRATKNKQRILLTSYLTIGCGIWIIWLYVPNILDSLLDMLFNPKGESLGAVDVEELK